MTDEELKKQIERLNEEIETLKKRLAENEVNDERRHQEIKKLQKQQHQDNIKWRKIGALGIFSTPATILITVIGYFWKKSGNNEKTKESKKTEKNTDLAALTELIKEAKK